MTAPAAAAPSAERQHNALQTIFSFFLGLMVVAFIGVGVNTFYPSPAETRKPELEELQRQQDALRVAADGRELAPAQQAKMDRWMAEENELQLAINGEEKGWARVTSIILVVFATLVMSVSLVRNEQLRVLGNGLLLGGLFTMVYGVGWVIFSGSSVIRFAVMAFALLVALGLGYAKFVRGRATEAPPAASGRLIPAGTGDVALANLETRVSALEERAAAAAVALGGPQGHDKS
jgi:hypothetical protein